MCVIVMYDEKSQMSSARLLCVVTFIFLVLLFHLRVTSIFICMVGKQEKIQSRDFLNFFLSTMYGAPLAPLVPHKHKSVVCSYNIPFYLSMEETLERIDTEEIAKLLVFALLSLPGTESADTCRDIGVDGDVGEGCKESLKGRSLLFTIIIIMHTGTGYIFLSRLLYFSSRPRRSAKCIFCWDAASPGL